DVRAADLREHARFLAKPAQQLGVGGDLGLEQLDRDIGATGRVARLPHLAHRAGAELLRELEAAEYEPHAGPRRPRHLDLAHRRARDERTLADEPAHELARARPRVRIARG